MITLEKTNNREFKGNSLLKSISDYVIIDIETTGLDSKMDMIIEFAGIKVKNNIIIDTYSTLINPNIEIDSFITNLTGITNKMIANAPTIDKKIKEILDFIGDNIIIGHNVNFDINFLYDNCELILNKPLINDYIDTLRLCRKLIESKNHKLETMANKFNIDYTNAHRALKDKMKREKFISKEKLKAKDFKINSNADITNPFYHKVCVITGTLEIPRKECMQLIANLGRINKDTVTKDTNYLILGNNDYNPILRGKKSNKLIKAENYKLDGMDIEIISENTFFDMIQDYNKIHT